MVRNLSYLYLFFVFCIFFVIAVLLDSEAFIDYFVYNKCLTNGWYPTFEPAMNVLCKFTSNFSDNIAIKTARIFSISLLVFTCLFFSTKFGPFTGLFFLYLNGFQTLGAYRQGTATILICLAVYYIVSRNKFREISLLALAFLFHFSSIFIILILFFRRFSGKISAIVFICTIFFIPIILRYPLFELIIPIDVLGRYINLTEGALPSSAYFALGKIWYVIYFSVLIAASTKYFYKNKYSRPAIESNLYYCFLPILISVPILTLMDSWAATRISSLTNGFELLFFIFCASLRMRVFMFTAYFVRTSIAFISFFMV